MAPSWVLKDFWEPPGNFVMSAAAMLLLVGESKKLAKSLRHNAMNVRLRSNTDASTDVDGVEGFTNDSLVPLHARGDFIV